MAITELYLEFDPIIYPLNLSVEWIGVPKIIRGVFYTDVMFNQPVRNFTPVDVYLHRISTDETIEFTATALSVAESGEFLYRLQGNISYLLGHQDTDMYRFGISRESIEYRDSRLGPSENEESDEFFLMTHLI